MRVTRNEQTESQAPPSCARNLRGQGRQSVDFLTLIAFLAFWIILQRYILPKLGVPT